MPLYQAEARWNAAHPLAETLEELEDSIQRSGGQLLQALQLDDALALTLETADELSLFRIIREAAEIGLQLQARAALSRGEAEALDAAHRARSR